MRLQEGTQHIEREDDAKSVFSPEGNISNQ